MKKIILKINRISFYLIVVFLLTSFDYHIKNRELFKQNTPDFIFKKNTIANFQIIGKWGIYVTINNKVHETCNDCPKVYFKKNSSSKLIKPSGEMEVFKWKVKNDTIFFSSNSNGKEKTFGNNKYLMKYERKEKFDELELKDIEHNNSYILRRLR